MVESNKIDADYIISYILRNYTGIVLKNLWGEKALLYNSNNKLLKAYSSLRRYVSTFVPRRCHKTFGTSKE